MTDSPTETNSSSGIPVVVHYRFADAKHGEEGKKGFGKERWGKKTSRWNMLVRFQTVAGNTSGMGYNRKEIRSKRRF